MGHAASVETVPAFSVPDGFVLAERFRGLRTLFFVLGTQKASTTWLARMLSKSAECHVSPTKELHYWDMRERRKARSAAIAKCNETIRNKLRDMALSIGHPARARVALNQLRLGLAKRSLTIDPSVQNYCRLLMRGRRDQPVVGELTPVYCLLSAETIRRMAHLHDDTRFVFVMRDPVDRLWSGVKQAFQTDTRPRDRVWSDIRATFEASIDDPSSKAYRLSDYKAIISNVEQAVEPDRIAYFFHETIRTDGEMRRLSSHLGLTGIDVEPERRVNRSLHDGLALPEDAARRARDTFEPTYAFVAERFGERMPPSWRAAPVN
ncbi:sulfotransferase [Palleronia sp. LCG004]|uniref:sulfotransferase n=1 Tax=Palleronia sp. LCG004 TaxID=3079304 RepID=UPI0029439C7D|nr:sulfotransferase [Palleronia sp. LCG004]WOI54901.1 sulfotransferase [Palleronia sp. LCG004]